MMASDGMLNPTASTMFAGLPASSTRRWKYFVYSLLAECLALAVLIQVGLVEPAKILARHNSVVITLAPPPPVPHNLQRIPPALVRPPRQVLQSPPQLARNELPPPPIERLREPELPKIEVKPVPVKPAVSEKPVFASATVPKSEPKPGPVVTTGSFTSSGSSATPNSTLQARQVQTGGFGDPNGIAGKNTSNGPSNIAHVGSFDMPQGEGYGNGTGGAHGARAVIASAGFGNGVAASGGNGHGTGGTVRATGFSDLAPVSSSSRPRAAAQPDTTSAEVLSKPTPSYTPEARALKLQGEVLLQVVFSADGKVQVLRVVRGLGHGLDEAAIRAAQQIRFKPATRGGAPVDSTATLHIVFQLA